MSWKPHRHRILVEVDKVEDRTKGGIVIAEQTRIKEQNQQVRATVLDVGPAAVVDDVIRQGVHVLIARWGGYAIPGSDTLRVISDEDICAVEVADA